MRLHRTAAAAFRQEQAGSGWTLMHNFLRQFFRSDQNLPDLSHDCLEEFQIPLLVGYDPFPVPLIDVRRVIVIQKIIFANGPHVSADALAGVTIELLQCDSLPLGGRLNHLGINGVLAAVV